jgi:hypothetical protein
MKTRSFHLEIFLISCAALIVEISYTRIFSFKFSSYFTYVIIAFALLGIGAGGVFVSLSERLRATATSRLVAILAPVGAAGIAAGYLAIALLEFSTYELSLRDLAYLALACLALFAAFLALGLLIARILAARIDSFPRLYLADLAGAGLGCAASVPLMLTLTPPGGIILASGLVAAAGLRSAWRESRPWAGLVALTAVLLVVGSVNRGWLPDPVVDTAKTMGRPKMEQNGGRSVFHRWHPIFRVDVLEGSNPRQKVLAHDGRIGSVLWRYDAPERIGAKENLLPFAVARRDPRVLIVGSAGGREIGVSLDSGASEVVGVELNPVTVSLLRDHFADFTGRLPEREEVTLINAEGRSFLRREQGEYDIIWFVAPDSYATMNAAQSSGFVLVEAYLYTREAIRDAVSRLAPGGVLCIQFGEVRPETAPIRTSRFLATARRALADLGIRDFGRHVLIAETPRLFTLTTILVSPTPFAEDQIDAFLEAADRFAEIEPIYAPGRVSEPETLPYRIITLPDPAAAIERSPFQVSPVSDDAPFFWHFVRWRDVLLPGRLKRLAFLDGTQGRGEIALLTMLGVCVVFAAGFLLLPFLAIRADFALLPAKGWAFLYFSVLGLGFMGYEISLIQKLTLFLGYPTYTLMVTLAGLLVSAGIGSLLTERYAHRGRVAVIVLIAILAALTVFLQFGIDVVAREIGAQPLGIRIAVALAILSPLGLCLGAFMPLGLRALSSHTPPAKHVEYVAWGWAVNGFFSVIGSMLVTILCMSFGFRIVLLLSLGLYLTTVVTLPRLAGRGTAS